jgi:hypothetical protein
MAKILAAYAEALHEAGDSDGARSVERLAGAMKKKGKLEVSFLRTALSRKDG